MLLVLKAIHYIPVLRHVRFTLMLEIDSDPSNLRSCCEHGLSPNTRVLDRVDGMTNLLIEEIRGTVSMDLIKSLVEAERV